MILCGRDVRMELAVTDEGASSALYDDAYYDGPGVYDGGAEFWLNLNPLTLSTAAVVPTNEAGDFRVEAFDPHRLLDPTRSPYGSRVGQGTRIRLTVDGVPLWTGRVAPDGWSYDLGAYSARIVGTDTVTDLAGWSYTEATFGPQTASQRFAAVLALHPSPPTLLAQGTGAAFGPLAMTGDIASMLGKVADSEHGYYWHGSTGELHWTARDALGADRAVKADLWDSDTGSGIVYESLDIVPGDPVINGLVVDRVRPSQQAPQPAQYHHADSRARYGPHVLTNMTLQHATDDGVAAWSGFTLDMYAVPQPGPRSVTIRLVDGLPYAERSILTVLALRMLNTVRVHLHHRGGSPQLWDAPIVGVTHDITPETWLVRLDLGRVGLEGSDVYDTATYDTTARYGYVWS